MVPCVSEAPEDRWADGRAAYRASFDTEDAYRDRMRQMARRSAFVRRTRRLERLRAEFTAAQAQCPHTWPDELTSATCLDCGLAYEDFADGGAA